MLFFSLIIYTQYIMEVNDMKLLIKLIEHPISLVATAYTGIFVAERVSYKIRLMRAQRYANKTGEDVYINYSGTTLQRSERVTKKK